MQFFFLGGGKGGGGEGGGVALRGFRVQERVKAQNLSLATKWHRWALQKWDPPQMNRDVNLRSNRPDFALRGFRI